MLKYHIEEENWLVVHTFRYLFDLFSIKAERVSSEENCDLYYGKNTLNTAKIFIERGDEKFSQDLLYVQYELREENARIVFKDFIHVLGQVLGLGAFLPATNEKLDLHQRKTIQNPKQIPGSAIANKLILEFKRGLEQAGFEPQNIWPEGKKSCIVLSHDVDIPEKYIDKQNYRFFRRPHEPRSVFRHHARFLKQSLHSFLKKDKDANWLFEDIMEMEHGYGFNSSFYFAARPYYDAKANPLDVGYNIRAPKYAHLCKRLLEKGFEIGLHASYNAHKDLALFSEEKKLLETVAKTKVIGLRHHFWHLGPKPIETLKLHQKAGFKYDSSVGQNYFPGFANEIALPYFPVDLATQSKIEVMQIPTFLMDGNLFPDAKVGVAAALKLAKTYIDQLIACDGLGSINWHVRTSHPSNKEHKIWGEVYAGILAYLSEKKEVWVCSGKDAYMWLESKNVLIDSEL